MGAKEGNEREIKDGIDIMLPDQKELAIPLMLPPPINDQLVEVREEVGLIVKDCMKSNSKSRNNQRLEKDLSLKTSNHQGKQER
jgi:hypothetical protein